MEYSELQWLLKKKEFLGERYEDPNSGFSARESFNSYNFKIINKKFICKN